MDTKGKTVALFPGPGVAICKYGPRSRTELPGDPPIFRQNRCAIRQRRSSCTYQKPYFPSRFLTATQEEDQQQKITATEFAQPAIGTLSAGFLNLLRNAGFKPDFTAGHSFGELTALWAAGVYSDADFFFLAKSRGKAMAPLSDAGFDAGTMLAVKGDVEAIKADIKAFPEVVLANLNSNTQAVLAGSHPAIAEVQKALVEKGYSVVPLDVSAAFHTPLVGHAQKPFADAIQKAKFKKPKVPVFSNSTGKQYPADPEKIQQILSDHILNPVNFRDEIEAIYSAGGSIFIEIGPKSVLTNLVNNILDGKPHTAIALNPNAKKDSDLQLREAVTQLCVLGMELQNFDPYSVPRKSQPETKKSSISVKLNGGLYLSEKTKMAFQDAINQQNSLTCRNTDFRAPRRSSRTTDNPAETRNYPSSPASTTRTDVPSGLSRIQAIQQETLAIHSKFLENDAEYTRLFGQLTQQELGIDQRQCSTGRSGTDQYRAANS